MLAPALVLMAAAAAPPSGAQDPVAAGRQALLAGRYEEAVGRLAAPAAMGDGAAARWLAEALVALGRYAEAEERLRSQLARQPQAWALWVAWGDASRARGDVARADSAYRHALGAGTADSVVAAERLAELAEERGMLREARTAYRQLWRRYRDRGRREAPVLAALARAVRRLGPEDPQLYREALRFYDAALAADSSALEVRVELGDLFLEKYNGADARAAYEAVLRVNPRHPGALVGLGRVVRFEGGGEIERYARASLAVNPAFVPAWLLLAEVDLDDESYAGALEKVMRALAANPSSLSALALEAGVHLVRGDTAGLRRALEQVSRLNPRCASCYGTLAEVAGRNRRYGQAVAFARQAIAVDSTYWRGYAHAGINELRLGRMAEARRSLEAAFAGDPYDVWTKNTLDLLDRLETFTVVATPRFRLVAPPGEADLVALYAGPLAEEAFDSLARRYHYRPPVPIRIELYDRHADFSVRAMGVVGVGALGVSFGPVVAMDSPSAREPGAFHWGSALWHEIAHSFHLGLSNGRLPRWLAEGLAVYEERRARPGWGDPVSLEFLRAVRAGKLLPLSQLNRGFARAESPQQLLDAYTEASLLCEMLVSAHGPEVLPALVAALGQGRSLDQALEAVAGLWGEALDRRFAKYLSERLAQGLAAIEGESDWVAGDAQEGVAAERLAQRAEERPADWLAQWQAGRALYAEGRLDRAERYLRRAQQLFPQYAGGDSPSWYLAQIYRRRGAREAAVAELAALTSINAAQYPALVALADLSDSLGRREEALAAWERAVYVYPFEVAAHQRAAVQAEALGRWASAVRERRAVLALDPADRAEAWYRLAQAYDGAGDGEAARRAVLRALEVAPTFEPALMLLLKIQEGRHGR
jgi:tetratricopeptide (TPR) repeat protein